MSKEHSEFVKKQFENEYKSYDDFIGKVVPGYEEMHKEVSELLDYPKDKKLRILDLGIGTGKTAKIKLSNRTLVLYNL